MKRILAIGIILLFIGMSISSSTGFDTVKQSNTAISNGKTLYVGGSGPNNYTKIQDAIDNASDGDTVYVYDDSSPYYEYDIKINKSINLIGENRDTTTVDGTEEGDVFIIKDTNNVTITDFTIRNSTFYRNIKTEFGGGIRIKRADNCTIHSNNIIKNGRWGVYIEGGSQFTTILNNDISRNHWAGIEFGHGKHCLIQNNIVDGNWIRGITLWIKSKNTTIIENIITNNFYGIYDTGRSAPNIISGNIISNNDDGIQIYSDSKVVSNNIISNNTRYGIYIDSDTNIISENFIFNNNQGIRLSYVYQNTIENNNISENKIGIKISLGIKNTIKHNNFIKNEKQCVSITSFRHSSLTNRWRGNYYNRWTGLIPKPIFRKLRIPTGGFPDPDYIKIPWFPQFDWHPAQEPYDIEV